MGIPNPNFPNPNLTPDTSLAAIQRKVRLLTDSPDEGNLTTNTLNNYINTFVLYGMPSNVALFQLKTTFSFYCSPNIEEYSTTTTNPTDPLYQFNQFFISIAPPLYIAGYSSFYSQSREQFFSIYPRVAFITNVGQGTGAPQTFSGTISQFPILQNNVLFGSTDVNGNGLTLIDVPQSATMGNLCVPNTIAPIYGTINYITGAFSFTFPTNVQNTIAVNAQTVPYQASRPLSALFYDDVFTLAPVPDQPYKITFDAYTLPTYLMQTTQSPDVWQWWEYIAYGAARKIFQDRKDSESLRDIEPWYKEEESKILVPTLRQLATQRAASIFTEQTTNGLLGTGWGFGGGLF